MGSSQQWSFRALIALVVFLGLVINGVEAWTSAASLRRSQRRVSSVAFYVPSNTPTTETPGIIAQKMLKNSNIRTRDQAPPSNVQLSQSMLESSDSSTLASPSLPTAHGLLSPEIVARLEELNQEGYRSEALVSFLKTYRRHGPMSCLPMLSNPNILPHLTNAMRDIMI